MSARRRTLPLSVCGCGDGDVSAMMRQTLSPRAMKRVSATAESKSERLASTSQSCLLAHL